MAYNYQMPNYYPSCGNCRCMNNKSNVNPCCCHAQQCYYHNQHACSYPQAHCACYDEEISKPRKNQKALRKNKVTKSFSSSCTMGFDCCGDNKENNHRNSSRFEGTGGYDCKRNCYNSSYSCCSSSRKPQSHSEEKRCRRESESRNFVASSCDINRLISMVRNPPLGASYGLCSSRNSCSGIQITDDLDEENYTLDCSIDDTATSLPPLPPPRGISNSTEYTDVETLQDDSLDIETVYRNSSTDGLSNMQSTRFQHMETRVKFMPPPSCFLLVKRADAQRNCKKDSQVQARFDISSDFCMCARDVCEYCAKKVICTCDRIRCCMCGKLKTTADRKVNVVSVCRCPKSYRCCEMATSFLRFNSSPALNKERSCLECNDIERRPLTY